MRALKIAEAAIGAVVVVVALLLVIGVPSGFMTSADPGAGRSARPDTSSPSTVVPKIGVWPSLNITLNDITLQGSEGPRRQQPRLTASSIQADVTLASVWSAGRRSPNW